MGAAAPGFSRPLAALALAILALGAALRVLRFAADRSLWLDECMLALNLEHSPGQWLSGLDYHQAAPIGFLYATRGLATLLAPWHLPIEYALRALPLLASLTSLVLFLALARRLLKPGAALLALAIFALSEPAVHYAAEFKPYALDACFTLALLVSTLDVTQASGPARGRLWRFTLIASLACWCSYPAFFLLPVCGLWLVGLGPRAQPRPQRERLLALGAVSISGALSVWLTLLPSLGDEVLTRYWQSAFAPFPPTTSADLAWYVREGLGLTRETLGLEFAGLGALCLALGVLIVASRERRFLWLFLGPLALALGASASGHYPWQARLLQFAAPILALLTGLGLEHLRALLCTRQRRVGAWVALGLLFLHPALDGLRDARHAPPSQEARQVLERMAERMQPGDRVYLYYGSVPAWRFYAPRVGLDALAVVEGSGWREGHVWEQADDPERWLRFAQDFDQLDGEGRVWVVISHIWRGAGVDDERLLRHLLDERGRALEQILEHESLALLYDLTATARNTEQRRALLESRESRESRESEGAPESRQSARAPDSNSPTGASDASDASDASSASDAPDAPDALDAPARER